MMGRMKDWMLEQEELRLADVDYGYTQFLRTYVPDEPALRYWHSMELLDALQKESKHLDGFPMFHRMQLLQHIAQMEAYLADRLVVLVSNFDDLLRNLVLKHESLKKQSYTLEAFVGNPHLVTEKATSYLKSLLYHELERAADVYRAALDIDIFPDKDLKSILTQAVIDRHHCVHRDGKDNDGKTLDIDDDYIAVLQDALKKFVGHIEEQCKSWVDQIPEKGFAKDPREAEIERRRANREI
jgi:hypothetical protein